jgi:hypothetical protein
MMIGTHAIMNGPMTRPSGNPNCQNPNQKAIPIKIPFGRFEIPLLAIVGELCTISVSRIAASITSGTYI